jgi:hypothetical protein
MEAAELVRKLFDLREDDQALRSGLREDVTLRVWRWDGAIDVRGRDRVLAWVRDEAKGWPDPALEVFEPAAESQPAAVQFRIQATENGRYMEHNRALFITYRDGLIQGIDLYCGEPVFSAHRIGYVAPATLTDDEVRGFLEEIWHGPDVREWMPLNRWRHDSRRITHAGSGDAHPGSNFIGGTRWTAEEADARIEEIVDDYRRRGIGFAWWVMPFDTPSDLCQRLERHGLLLAGQNLRMARLGLDDLSVIPANERLVIETLDGTNDEAIEALLRIVAVCFHQTSEQIANYRDSLHERTRDAEARQKEIHCLAYLDGVPVGEAAAAFRLGYVHLAGASTLPEYRSQKVYSTLLKHRLMAGQARGYHLAAIDAGPMSRRVVAKYGFREFGTVDVYGWMPEMNPEVIKSLVPDE